MAKKVMTIRRAPDPGEDVLPKVEELKTLYPDDVVEARVRHRTTNVHGRGNVITTKDVLIDGYLVGWCRETIPFSIFKGTSESYTPNEVYDDVSAAAKALTVAGLRCDLGDDDNYGTTGAGVGLSVEGNPYDDDARRSIQFFTTGDGEKGFTEGDPLRHLLLLYDKTMKAGYEALGPPTGKGPFDEDEGMSEEHRKTGEDLFRRCPRLPGLIGGHRI